MIARVGDVSPCGSTQRFFLQYCLEILARPTVGWVWELYLFVYEVMLLAMVEPRALCMSWPYPQNNDFRNNKKNDSKPNPWPTWRIICETLLPVLQPCWVVPPLQQWLIGAMVDCNCRGAPASHIEVFWPKKGTVPLS